MEVPNVFSLFPQYGEKILKDVIGIAIFITIHFAFYPGAGVFLLVTLLTPLKYLLLLYMLWILYDFRVCERGGREISLCRWIPIFKCYTQYFPITVTTLDNMQLDARRNYMFCQFPHGRGTGFGSATWFMYSLGTMFPHHNPRMVMLTQFFFIPFLREIFLTMGSIAASTASLDYVLSSDEEASIVALMVGGTDEVILAEPGVNKIVLKNRKGFVKIALRNGSPLVPVFSFGEVDLVDNVMHPTWKKIQGFLNTYLNVPINIPKNIIPKRLPITVVVGRPINVVKNPNPTDEEVDKLHSIFMQELVKLFESEKHKYLEDADSKNLEIL